MLEGSRGQQVELHYEGQPYHYTTPEHSLEKKLARFPAPLVQHPPHNVLDVGGVTEDTVLLVEAEDSSICLAGLFEEPVAIVPEVHPSLCQLVDSCHLGTQTVGVGEE